MKERIISAIIMMIIAAPFLFIGNIYFAIFTAMLGVMAGYEFLKLKDIPLIIKLMTYLITVILIFKDYLNLNLEIFIILILMFYLLMQIFYDKSKFSYKDAFFLSGLVLFLGIAFSSIIKVRNQGLNLFIYFLLITVSTDSFALFIGKKFGKHKLAPTISPNKTIEGLIGGTIIGTIIATIFNIFTINTSSIYLVIIETLILSLVGSIGDLIRSSIKRTEGIKDFSNLIPGHGGIMDRLDSIIFVILTYILISGL